MKTIKFLTSAIAVVAVFALSSCSKSNNTPFDIYLVSSQSNFPPEMHVVYNSNFIGNIKKVGTENLSEISKMKSNLNTIERQIEFKIVDNKSTVLAEFHFSLLPDGTYKKVSSFGELKYDLRTIDNYKFAIFFNMGN